MLLQPGVLSIAWGTAIRQLAAGSVSRWTRSRSRTSASRRPRTSTSRWATSRRARWPRCSSRFAAWSSGQPAIVIEHITRLRPDLRPDWPQPASGGGSYRVEITGEPSYAVDIVPSSRYGDHNHAAIAGAAGRIVNAIPAVLAAPPGIRTTIGPAIYHGQRAVRARRRRRDLTETYS